MTTLATTLDQVMTQWAMSHQPIIKPVLKRGARRKWTVRLEEVFPSVDDAGNYYNSSDLDNRVEWAFEILKTWKTAHRSAWDMWMFDSKREAEKFVALYGLTWVQ
jgi:hypothetical protein